MYVYILIYIHTYIHIYTHVHVLIYIYILIPGVHASRFTHSCSTPFRRKACGQRRAIALKYDSCVKRDPQKIPTIETNTCEDLHKRPAKETHKRDPQKRPTKEACGQRRAIALRHDTCSKDTHNRDLHVWKETYTKDLQKRPTKETNKRGLRTAACERSEVQHMCKKRPTEETSMCKKRPARVKRDLQKRPTKETCKRDLQKRPTKETCITDALERPAGSGAW